MAAVAPKALVSVLGAIVDLDAVCRALLKNDRGLCGDVPLCTSVTLLTSRFTAVLSCFGLIKLHPGLLSRLLILVQRLCWPSYNRPFLGVDVGDDCDTVGFQAIALGIATILIKGLRCLFSSLSQPAPSFRRDSLPLASARFCLCLAPALLRFSQSSAIPPARRMLLNSRLRVALPFKRFVLQRCIASVQRSTPALDPGITEISELASHLHGKPTVRLFPVIHSSWF
ncbi:hypothetical protein OE88DRAFT_712441 [Heliocybe sulcata]|uniref:Uncharacterized protein n=1 Tax=Heliocybe sulcata TaxID=5364 RepID=A0A5C3NFJ6_9AGAM|nr:hypothetical protein OE88DRAFT_712441 [Heliocybe sulcata]